MRRLTTKSFAVAVLAGAVLGSAGTAAAAGSNPILPDAGWTSAVGGLRLGDVAGKSIEAASKALPSILKLRARDVVQYSGTRCNALFAPSGAAALICAPVKKGKLWGYGFVLTPSSLAVVEVGTTRVIWSRGFASPSSGKAPGKPLDASMVRTLLFLAEVANAASNKPIAVKPEQTLSYERLLCIAHKEASKPGLLACQASSSRPYGYAVALTRAQILVVDPQKKKGLLSKLHAAASG